jgi:hypothetical protein
LLMRSQLFAQRRAARAGKTRSAVGLVNVARLVSGVGIAGCTPTVCHSSGGWEEFEKPALGVAESARPCIAAAAFGQPALLNESSIDCSACAMVGGWPQLYEPPQFRFP